MSGKTERLMLELCAAIREEVGALPENISTLADEVKLARAQSRMSLQELADASGFTKSHVWEVEKGRARNPTVGLIAGLARALGVPFLRLAQAALNTSEAPPAVASGEAAAPLPTEREDSRDTLSPDQTPPEGG